MENFIVSARKYRPVTFNSVVGQPSITATLKNAIKNNHLAQAYLFCGPRGVGKTTCARIFAKTINCQNITNTVEACDNCESCETFNNSNAYNIHELDAASNNSVEDIRNLIEQVRIPPQVAKYSIYIIDEVHMLSAQAFNAFLKTLEEPPAHAIFVLATTEKHKIIPTILSRCQIFDFNRIKTTDIVDYLEKIAKNENIKYETEALNIIAQKADGAMRDALSIFDQVVSFSSENITYKNVIENLNVLDLEYYFKITNNFLKSNISDSLLLFNEVLDKGFDAHQFITGLSEHFRNILVGKDKATLQLLEVSSQVQKKYKDQANLCPAEFLFEALKISNTCDLGYKISQNKRLHVELALIQLCNILSKKKTPEVITQKSPKQTSKETEIVKEKTKSPLQDTQNKNNLQAISQQQTTTPSIKDALLGKTKQKVNELDDNHNTDTTSSKELKQEFTQKNLEKVWGDFANSIKQSKRRLYSTLIAKKPELKDNFVVELTVNNSLQNDAVNEIRLDLLKYLRKQLENTLINLTIIIKEDDQDLKLYTLEDKFQHMSKKNSNLLVLKQKLNLDFE